MPNYLNAAAGFENFYAHALKFTSALLNRSIGHLLADGGEGPVIRKQRSDPLGNIGCAGLDAAVWPGIFLSIIGIHPGLHWRAIAVNVVPARRTLIVVSVIECQGNE